MSEKMRPKGPLEGGYSPLGGGYGGRDLRPKGDIDLLREMGRNSPPRGPFRPKGYRPERGFKFPKTGPSSPGKTPGGVGLIGPLNGFFGLGDGLKFRPDRGPGEPGSRRNDPKKKKRRKPSKMDKREKGDGNPRSGPAGVVRPAGYNLPGMPAPDYHWGPHDCGVTNFMASRTDNGWLSPESSFACAPGQVFNTDHSPVEYGDDFVIPAINGGGMPSVTLGRRNNSVLAPRMTVIEHFGWANPQPTGPQPVQYRPPAVGPIPGLKPPRPEPAGHGEPSPGAEPPPHEKGDPPLDKPDGPPIPPHKNYPPDADGPKGKWRFKYGPLWKIYGWLTELEDFLECYEKSVYGPERARKAGQKPLQERMLDLAYNMYYTPPTEQEFADMTACMYSNGASDAAIGKWSKMADEITKSPYWKSPYGPTAGYGGVGKGGPSVRF